MICFVLLASPRTGSTALRLTLTKHPRVRIHGELFRAVEAERVAHFQADPYVLSLIKRGALPPSAYKDETDAAQYVRSTIFVPWQKNERAVGFKLFYEHARNHLNAATLWDFLVATQEIRIIHLRRRNLLAAYVSFTTATQTGEWIRLRDAERVATIPTLIIDPAELLKFFEYHSIQQLLADNSFSHHLVLRLEYESDVLSHFRTTVRKIHDFLEVGRGAVEPVTMRQAVHSLSLRIKNYRVIKEHFSRTPYAEFFSD